MPARKPLELKVLQGTHRPDREPANVAKPQPLAPTMPRGLPKAAQDTWKSLAPKLEKLGLLTQIDGPAFAALCLHYGLAYEAAREIGKGQLTTIDERKLPRKHPLHSVLMAHSAALRMYCQEFGLTPASRGKLALPADPDKADDFFGF